MEKIIIENKIVTKKPKSNLPIGGSLYFPKPWKNTNQQKRTPSKSKKSYT